MAITDRDALSQLFLRLQDVPRFQNYLQNRPLDRKKRKK